MAYIPRVIRKELCPVCDGTGRKGNIFKESKVTKAILKPEPFDLDFCNNCYGTGKVNIWN